MLTDEIRQRLENAQSVDEFNEILRQENLDTYATIADLSNSDAELYAHYSTLVAAQQVAPQISQIDAAVESGEMSISEAEQVKDELGYGQFDYPPWIAEAIGQRELTDEEKADILTDFRMQYDPSIRTFDDLVATGFLDSPIIPGSNRPSPASELVLGAVIDIEPQPAHIVRLDYTAGGGTAGRNYSIQAPHFDAAQAIWNLKPRDVTRLVRLADRMGLREGDQVLWQPFVEILKITGQLDDVLQDTSIPSPDHGGVPSERMPEVVIQRGRDTSFGGLAPGIIRGEGLQLERSRVTGTQLAEEFKEGLEKYDHDPGLAMLHVLDPGLATRARAEIKQYGTVSGQSMYQINTMLHQTGSSFSGWMQDLVDTGFTQADVGGTFGSALLAEAIAEMEAASREAAGGGSERQGPQEPIVQLPDPAALDETMRSLYQEMFFKDPTAEQLSSFRSQINAAVSAQYAAEPGDTITNVDVQARAMEGLRNDPRYAELYGKKPGGMSEQDYRRQFQAGQASILGEELAGNAAVQAGMRSGKYQTAVGAAAGSAEAFNNSVFMGRLARAAEVIGAST